MPDPILTIILFIAIGVFLWKAYIRYQISEEDPEFYEEIKKEL